jgi:DNA-binding response OmpR family regulator
MPNSRLSMRVLLTEDNSALAEVLTEFLEDEGHQVTRTADACQARHLPRGTGWDAWILDPGGNSFAELSPADAAELRRLAAHVPVVVTTGRTWAHQVEPAELGVCAILPKPFDLSELTRILDTLPPRTAARQRGPRAAGMAG